MDEIIEIPEDYPYTECEVCGEEIEHKHIHDVGNQYVCGFCAQYLEAQEDNDNDDEGCYEDDDYDDRDL
jgi:ribosome-binding protein aMBF1 (putative translation factor)